MRIAIAVRRRIETDEVEQLFDTGLLVRRFQPSSRGIVATLAAHGEVWEQPDLLDDVADAATQRDRVDERHVLAVDHHPSSSRIDQPVDQTQRGGLATT